MVGGRGLAREDRQNEARTRKEHAMKIKWTTIYVNDQENALRFYTEVLGFVKKADFTNGSYRWLTVASPEEPDGTELHLELNANPAAKEYQEALFKQEIPATQFLVDDLDREYEGIINRGGDFTKPPTSVTGSKVATLSDTCGNLIQLAQLMW
jgi:predicted enzyme related to lactoylglutathione lyase